MAITGLIDLGKVSGIEGKIKNAVITEPEREIIIKPGEITYIYDKRLKYSEKYEERFMEKVLDEIVRANKRVIDTRYRMKQGSVRVDYNVNEEDIITLMERIFKQ